MTCHAVVDRMRQRDSPGESMRSTTGFVLGTVSLLVASQLGLAASDSPAVLRGETIAILRSLAHPDGTLRLSLRHGGEEALPVGAPLDYRVSSRIAAHLTLLHVDPHGVVSVVFPGRLEARAGEEQSLPAMEAAPPLGQEDLFLVATPFRVTAETLGVEGRDPNLAVVDASQGPALARRLRGLIADRGAAGVALARLQQRVVPRAEGPTLTRGEIIDVFSRRTRAIARPRLDLQIHFATASAELDGAARRDLDEFGYALASPELSGERFAIAGHTDDVGEEDYNLDLSRRRAESVMRFLIEAYEIAAPRLRVEAHGESRPLEPGTSAEARRMNRRVEFSLVN